MAKTGNSTAAADRMNGEQILLDSKNKPISEFSLQPIAWRIFEENLFAKGRKETWAEVFFIDDRNRVGGIMFNGSTLEELRRLSEDLCYDDIQLSDIVLTVKAEKKNGRKTAKSKRGTLRGRPCGRFSYQLAEPDKVKELREFAQDFPIYRRDTLTATAVYLVKSDTFYLPWEESALQLSEGEAPLAV